MRTELEDNENKLEDGRQPDLSPEPDASQSDPVTCLWPWRHDRNVPDRPPTPLPPDEGTGGPEPRKFSCIAEIGLVY
jgi:hypothetical protein